ncbi:alpha/beta fold hydrolase [Rhizobium helianthi]|uniref:Alpha/beta fold hydrolase n=1 Tax=Rhizobium helianthi TaxID=1132695 RepID=A0ABW4M4B0_9HYPH
MNLIGQRITFPAADGYPLGGFLWRHAAEDRPRTFVLICSATSVRCRYYARFASYLFENGFNVATFDYRGIGESRPAYLRRLDADWADWGEQDIEGAIGYICKTHEPAQLHAVAHSIGGFALGLAPSAVRLSRILTLGSQFAYWRDYAPKHRMTMYFKWHVVMPLLTGLFGYFPAKQLGWMEDTPAGVASDWARMGPRFELSIRRRLQSPARTRPDELTARLARVTAPILSLAATDDPYATPKAVERLLQYYVASSSIHVPLEPAMTGRDAIGHFAYFHERFRETLWPVFLRWLSDGLSPTDTKNLPS